MLASKRRRGTHARCDTRTLGNNFFISFFLFFLKVTNVKKKEEKKNTSSPHSAGN